MGKYTDYKDLAKELYEQGKGSGTVANEIMEGRGLDPHEYRNFSREIRKWASRGQWRKPDQFSKDMEEAQFPANLEFSHGWLKTDKASIFIRNKTEIVSFDEMREDFIKEMKEHSPKFEKIKRENVNDRHLLVIDPSDIHVNKLSSEEETGQVYNSEIAVKRVKDAIDGILSKSSGFPLDKIVLVIGNDVLNTDNTMNTTTKGTNQDVSNRWYEAFRMAKQMYIDVISKLVQVADLEVIHVMSNHDYVSGWMLADSLYSWYRNHDNITFDTKVRHRKYFKWGNNLIGLSHGDKFKSSDAPLLMANEAPKMWSETYYRYFYLHHIHHKVQTKFQSGKDYQGVTVQHLRSPSPEDLWHMDSGYCHSKQAIEAFIHHKEDGQVCCLTHNF